MKLNLRISMRGLALGAGALLMATTFASAQDTKRAARPDRGGVLSQDGTVVVPGSLEWLVRSDLSAERAGVLKDVFCEEGSVVQKGDEIARLNDTVARLTVEKQRLIAESDATVRKATAQREQAKAKLSKYKRLEARGPGFASRDELDTAMADLNYADALLVEARDKQASDKKDMELAQEALAQHRILAPFTGVIIERRKHPGEALQEADAVVRIGSTERFKFVGWLSLENSQRIRPGDSVQFRAVVDSADLAVENRVFQGKVLAVGTEIPQVGNPETSITAEIVNPFDAEHPELMLLQGLKGELTITPRTAGAAGGVATGSRPRLDAAVSTARQR